MGIRSQGFGVVLVMEVMRHPRRYPAYRRRIWVLHIALVRRVQSIALLIPYLIYVKRGVLLLLPCVQLLLSYFFSLTICRSPLFLRSFSRFYLGKLKTAVRWRSFPLNHNRGTHYGLCVCRRRCCVRLKDVDVVAFCV